MLHVLIVDDQPSFRSQLRQLLAHAGLAVVGEAADIPAAETLLGNLQPKPEIAVVNIMLPGINGLQGTARLKALVPTLRVYLVSAYRDQAQVFKDAAEMVGAEAFIAKDELDLETLRKWQE